MPCDTTYDQHRAQVELRFLVIGGGIAGLATAYCLRKAGHQVLVLEKGGVGAGGRGGIQCPPNMTKILCKWGLGPMLAQKARKCDRFVFYNADRAERIGTMIMSEEFLQDLIGDLLFIRHADLHEMLYNLAIQEGVEFRFNTGVEEIESGGLVLSTGEHIRGDIIIAADGYDSAARKWIETCSSSSNSSASDEDDQTTAHPGENLNGDKPEKHVALTFMIPASEFQANKDLSALFNPNDWFSALGEGYILNGFYLPDGDEITITLIQRYESDSGDDDDWTETRDIDSYHLDMSAFEPRMQAFLKLAKVISSRTFVYRPSPEDIVSECGKVVLVGNAAHPVMPGRNHGTALCIEDAQTLGLLFSRIQSREQIPRLVTAFDEIRLPHFFSTLTYDYAHHKNLIAAKGEPQLARDAILRQSMVHGESWEHIDEDAFRLVWEKELALYAHDASERVEDWWIQWGALISRNRQSGRLSVIANMSVSVSKAAGGSIGVPDGVVSSGGGVVFSP
ncbi:hypothetical protein CVT24_008962 [Panaeolus cyanescens]|uniref:FAD-binding domain-containing protein n=1 Tax=Panaeolus cyanescens TaxID=181874 RepID=A0A409YAR9_9AGAR|nr:hypothetical protein CVT24_008962 [Panaeolus cyanescens]